MSREAKAPRAAEEIVLNAAAEGRRVTEEERSRALQLMGEAETARRADEHVKSYAAGIRAALDVEATKAQLAESHKHELARVRALRERADGEVARLEKEQAHVEGEFRKGDLTAKRYEPLMAKIESELAAAQAEAERLAGSEAEVERDDGFVDVEEAVLERLTAIRRAMAGEIRDAEDAELVRAALRRLFREFVVSVPKDGEATIWPKWRAERVERACWT